MYHNQIQQKATERNELAALMAAFAGRVEICSSVDRAPIEKKESKAIQTAKPSTHREAAKKEAYIVKLMRENIVITTQSGSSPRTPRQMRKLLQTFGVSIVSPEIERLAARHQIRLMPPKK